MSLQEATKIPICADLGESESLGKGGHSSSSSTLLLHYEEELDSAGLEFLAPEVVSGASLSSANFWIYEYLFSPGPIVYFRHRFLQYRASVDDGSMYWHRYSIKSSIYNYIFILYISLTRYSIIYLMLWIIALFIR